MTDSALLALALPLIGALGGATWKLAALVSRLESALDTQRKQHEAIAERVDKLHSMYPKMRTDVAVIKARLGMQSGGDFG